MLAGQANRHAASFPLLAKKDDQPPKKRRTTQPGHVDVLLPRQEIVSPGAEARPAATEPLAPRIPPNVGTLGRGRVFLHQNEDETPLPVAPERGEAAPRRRRRWPWLLVVGTVVGIGLAVWQLRDQLFGPPPAPPAPPENEVVSRPLASVPSGAVFLHSGPYEKPELRDAFVAPDGRRYAFLFREGGAYGFAGAGKKKTANNLNFNGRQIHLGEAASDALRLGYFEETDRFWHKKRVGESEHLVLEDDESDGYDLIGPPVESFDGQAIGYWARIGKKHFVIVGEWTSAPYDRPVAGPWFSLDGTRFAYLVGGTKRSNLKKSWVVTCIVDKKSCRKTNANPVRSIWDFSQRMTLRQGFFVLQWLAEKSGPTKESLEELILTRNDEGQWQAAPITRATSSLIDVPIGSRRVDLSALMAETGIERPYLVRLVSSDDGGSIALIASSRHYVAGDGVLIFARQGQKTRKREGYVRCEQVEEQRDWLVLSPDHSRVAYCHNDPAVGERIVVGELKMSPYAYVMTRPVFSPDGESVAYFAIKNRKWWLVVDHREFGPYDELFDVPRFDDDGGAIWFGARRDRALSFERVRLRPLGQPADAVEL